MSRKHMLAFAICLGLGSLSPTVVHAIQKQPKKYETIQVSPGKGLTAQNEASETEKARNVLQKIASAQHSLEENKADLAQAQLLEAQILLEQIKANEPTEHVIEKVHTARKDLEKSQDVSIDLIPLDAELVNFETVAPAPMAKHHLQLAHKNIASKDKNAASQELLEVENNLIYAEAALPVNRTYQDVVGAQYMLSKNQLKAAQKMLQDSQQHIVMMAADAKTDQTVKVNPEKQ